jgi:LCP family protein required for cell wall assembly
VSVLLFLDDVAGKINPLPGVDEKLEAVESDAPQTVLIIGSDRRKGDPLAGARSDTTMLLRVDPDKDVLSVFSLPRDLEVPIPGYSEGTKLNEAYTIGGAPKTLATVKNYTGLPINHVVEINFEGFADAVNAIDCVYVDVDREYFNDNSTAVSELDTYAPIDINAGYQRLCGEKALQYVRFRHDDNDIVRAARQQDFLREARQKVDPKELLPVFGDTGNELIDIFTEYTRSDIDSTSQVLGILKSFIAVRESPVNQVKFEGYLGDATNTNVTTTQKQLEAALDQFLNGTGTPDEEATEEEPAEDSGDEEKKDKPKPDKEKKPKDPLEDANVVPVDQLADPDAFSRDAEKNGRRLDFPVFSPTVVPPDSAFNVDSRTYEFENEDNKKEDAYKIVITYNPTGVDEYFGVMGTTWDDPPILRNPTDTIEIDGREYLLFYDGDRLRMVGWKEDGNPYWLNNTLSKTIDETEMLAMASTMREVE